MGDMKHMTSMAVLFLSVALSATLSACGSDESNPTDSSSSSSVSATTQAPSPPEVEMSSEESTMSEAPVSPDGEDSTAAPEYEANDSTEVCTELAEQSAPILMKALENADKPDAITAAYSELAALYEDGVGKVESQKAKDAFTAMAGGTVRRPRAASRTAPCSTRPTRSWGLPASAADLRAV